MGISFAFGGVVAGFVGFRSVKRDEVVEGAVYLAFEMMQSTVGDQGEEAVNGDDQGGDGAEKIGVHFGVDCTAA